MKSTRFASANRAILPIVLMLAIPWAALPLAAFDFGFGALDPYDPLVLKGRPGPYLSNSASCYCVTHGIEEPCIRVLSVRLEDRPCQPGPGVRCGHVEEKHTPDDVFEAGERWWEKGGFLVNQLEAEPRTRTATLTAGHQVQDPVILPFRYYAGQVTGRYLLTMVATEALPGHIFLTPTDFFPGRCESHTSCTTTLDVMVARAGFEELPPPPTTVREESTGQTHLLQFPAAFGDSKLVSH